MTVAQAGLHVYGLTVKECVENSIGSWNLDATLRSHQDIKGRKVTILNYMDSNNFAEYGYDVMPYANGSSPGYSAYDSERLNISVCV